MAEGEPGLGPAGGDPDAPSGEGGGREISNAILANLVAELRERGGTDLVERVRERAGEPRSTAEFTFLLGWSRLDQAVALFRAAVEVTGDPDVPFRAGQQMFKVIGGSDIMDTYRSLPGPETMYQFIGPSAAKVTAVTDAEALETSDRRALVRYSIRPPFERDRYMCRYSAGTLSMFPTVFGFAPASITELECAATGAPACLYEVTWEPRSLESGPTETRLGVLQERLDALSLRFENLEAIAQEMSSATTVDAALRQVVAFATTAVTTPHHLLAVRLPGERRPRVQAVGLSPEDAQVLAAELLADPERARPSWEGPHLAVEVASSRWHYGCLAAFSPPGHEFFPNEDRLLMAYAGHGASLLDAAVALEENRLLVELAAELAELGATEDTAGRIAGAALRATGLERAAVLLWQPEDGRLVRTAHAQWEDDRIRVAVGARSWSSESGDAPGGMPGWALDAATVQAWSQAPSLPVFFTGESAPVTSVAATAGVSHGVVVPIVARHQLLGVIVAELDRAAADEVQGEAGRRARAVANLAAPALDGARLLELVQHQAHHDPLTGLPNARLIGDRLEVAVAQARRSGSPVALLFVDLDGFKEVNDQLGHGAGDAVLREVASRLLQTVREADTVARLGGDEFVVLLPALRGPEDAEVARRRVGDVLASVPAVVGEEVVALRASIGLASFPEDGETASDLLHRADIAMYRAKVSHRAARAS